jgi:PhnB protein
MLIIGSGVKDLSFYEKALGAVERRRFTNDDGSIHVMEMEIDGALFHFHEEKPSGGNVSPEVAGGVTTVIGLFVEDVDTLVERAVAAGARLLSPPQDYFYGFRQARIEDSFGHHWEISQVIS